ncbi:MAG: histone deacetylase [Elusimicrobiota bacterium]|nr:histone deacetylase [Endomicrobiia bacterium]MDW8165779.1 histone deacetylase [Elusimicrobiota bacterium]
MNKNLEIIYSPKYEVNLMEHPFDTKIYRLIKEKIQKEFKNIYFIEPSPVKIEYLLEVHTKEYIEKILNLNLSLEEILQLEIPLNREIVNSFLITVNGTILASDVALKKRIGLHIGGGFHHAYSDHGEGFCVFNDIAVAIKYLKKKKIRKIAVIDCDVHQGNGTAKIFQDDKDVFTFSIHQKDIYPIPKEKSTLDIELNPNTTDDEYLNILEDALKKIEKFSPEFIFYQAGVDIYEYDQLGGLKITKEGILKRDKLIYEFFKQKPIVVTLGGGYALDINDTVELHYNTLKIFINGYFDEDN